MGRVHLANATFWSRVSSRLLWFCWNGWIESSVAPFFPVQAAYSDRTDPSRPSRPTGTLPGFPVTYDILDWTGRFRIHRIRLGFYIGQSIGSDSDIFPSCLCLAYPGSTHFGIQSSHAMNPIRHEESERMPMTLLPNRPLPEASFDPFDGVICRGRQAGRQAGREAHIPTTYPWGSLTVTHSQPFRLGRHVCTTLSNAVLLSNSKSSSVGILQYTAVYPTWIGRSVRFSFRSVATIHPFPTLLVDASSRSLSIPVLVFKGSARR